MFDAEHSQTTPKDFTIEVQAVSQSWNEGLGLDMEDYSDLDASNYISASSGHPWAEESGKAKATITTLGSVLNNETITLFNADGVSTVFTTNNSVLPENGGNGVIGIQGISFGDATANAITHSINNTAGVGILPDQPAVATALLLPKTKQEP